MTITYYKILSGSDGENLNTIGLVMTVIPSYLVK